MRLTLTGCACNTAGVSVTHPHRHTPKHRFALTLALAAIAVTAGCRMAPLMDPRPVAVSTSPEETRVAIVRALMRNRWVVESEKPGEIVARLNGGGWNMVVAIHYADQVTFNYVSSFNLGYDDSEGAPQIHRGYNARAKSLADEIALQIAMQRATETPAVAAPPPAAEPPH